jgi:hypothetical protein
MVEPVPEPALGLVGHPSRGHRILEHRTVGEEDVEPAVVVVVEERHSSAHGLEQVLVRGGGVRLLEVDPDRPVTSVKRTSGTDGAAARSRSDPQGRIQDNASRPPFTIGPVPADAAPRSPFASSITKRWFAGRSRKVSLRPDGQATSTTSAAAVRPSPKCSRRSLCE